MYGFLATVGFIAVVLLVTFIIKKVNDYYKNTNYKIHGVEYDAAKKFAQGASCDEIRDMLINNIDFDREDVEEILALSTPHRTDSDGGNNAFIKAVNKV